MHYIFGIKNIIISNEKIYLYKMGNQESLGNIINGMNGKNGKDDKKKDPKKPMQKPAPSLVHLGKKKKKKKGVETARVY